MTNQLPIVFICGAGIALLIVGVVVAKLLDKHK